MNSFYNKRESAPTIVADTPQQRRLKVKKKEDKSSAARSMSGKRDGSFAVEMREETAGAPKKELFGY